MFGMLDRALTPKRVQVEELLDDHDAPAADVERSLRDLRRFNLLAGGRRAWKRLLRLAGGLGRNESILEIGTGTSDLLEAVPRDALRIGLDIKIDHLIYGKRVGDSSILRVVGDATRLPFRDGSIHLVGSSHFFHHFDLETNRGILDECLRVARRSVFVTDTRRNRLPLIFVQLLGFARLVGRITRFDAPASVLQGYTTAEISDFARRLTPARTRVVQLIPFRFGLIVWKDDASNG